MLRRSIHYAEKGVRDTLDSDLLDAVVLPALATHGTSMAAVLGWPIITVPMCYYPEDADILYDEREDLVTQGPGFP